MSDTHVCWTTYGSPKTVVTVGVKAIAWLCDNIVCLLDIETKAMNYYAVNGDDRGSGISHLIGHERTPIFGYVEAVLKPRIFVMKYPELTPLVIFNSVDAVNYVDLRFNIHAFLVAVSGYPQYTIYVWSLHTERLYCKVETGKKSIGNCLLLSTHNLVEIVHRSVWQNQITVWKLCPSEEEYYLNKIIELDLSDDYTNSQFSSMCFGDDEKMYIVNDNAMVSTLQKEELYFKKQWEPTEAMISNESCYQLYNIKEGLIVSHKTKMVFLRKNREKWIVLWLLDSEKIPILKIVSTPNTNYLVTDCANLYTIEVNVDNENNETISGHLAEFYTNNCYIFAYTCLKSKCENEAILIGTDNCMLRYVSCADQHIYSNVYIENLCTLTTHDTLPIVAVGTTTGIVHFISYENIENPEICGEVDCNAYSILCICLLDTRALIYDTQNNIYVVQCDYFKNVFGLLMQIKKDWSGHIDIIKAFLTTTTSAIFFITHENVVDYRYATELWCYSWPEDYAVKKFVYDLPYKYSSFEKGVVTSKSQEFFAVRIRDYVFDILNLKIDELSVETSIQTSHYGFLLGITASRSNLLTWGINDTRYHYSFQKYINTHCIQTDHNLRFLEKQEDINGKFLVNFYFEKYIIMTKLELTIDKTHNNSEVAVNRFLERKLDNFIQYIEDRKTSLQIIPQDILKKQELISQLNELTMKIQNLMDYDFLVTGKTEGRLKKFCLNSPWLSSIIEQSHLLCSVERKSIMDAIEEQNRIKDWILSLSSRTTRQVAIRLRAIFANTYIQNYSVTEWKDVYRKNADFYLFYNMTLPDENSTDAEFIEQMQNEENARRSRPLIRHQLILKGSAYEHIMSDESRVQDISIVTLNQVCNEYAIFKTIMNEALKTEFNKKFWEVYNFKFETMNNIIKSNAMISKIYDNMKIMCSLLNIKYGKYDTPMNPEWQNDEIAEKILAVNDSELFSINRRKRPMDEFEKKSARALLWPLEFWIRTLMVMMDGVLEKLWEEEIKKTPPMPEFALKKKPEQFLLEEVKLWNEYEEKIRILTEDRKEYLRILQKNEVTTIELKNNSILKFNERCTQLVILKLKYDFANRSYRMRLLNMKCEQLNRIQYHKYLAKIVSSLKKCVETIPEYVRLVNYWKTSLNSLKKNLNNYNVKSQQLDKQFKSFARPFSLNITKELIWLYKQRPKGLQKCITDTLVCWEVAKLVVRNPQTFPLTNENLLYPAALYKLDELQNMKHIPTAEWEFLTKHRRQKIEIELYIKGINFHVTESQNALNTFINIQEYLEKTKKDIDAQLTKAKEAYFESMKNQRLQIILRMGQVEVDLNGSTSNIDTDKYILMHIDDVFSVNKMIQSVGEMKSKCMQKVAVYRRQIIYTEWQHKVISTQIEYAKNILDVISKCRVTNEFLKMLRNWKRDEKVREKLNSDVHVIEKETALVLSNYIRGLVKLDGEIKKVKQQLKQMRLKNKITSRSVEDMESIVTLSNSLNDVMVKAERDRGLNERISKVRERHRLVNKVRSDYVHILELTTIRDLLRLRKSPDLQLNEKSC